MDRQHNSQGGYVLIAVLLLISLGLMVSASMLNSSATNAKARALVTTQADYYYDVEGTLNKVVAWMQDNSKNLITAFTAANFDNNFDLGSPSVGTNEAQFFSVATMVKMKNSSNSVMLSNNPGFGTSAFPATTNLDSGAAFDAAASFAAADLGAANARVVLIWARETDGNYEPIFRIDVMTGNNPDRGVHSFSYVYSTLVTSNVNMMFYGKDFLNLQTGNNQCSSYQYSYDAAAGWSSGAVRSNCGIGSDNAVTTSAKVNGSAFSNIDPGVTLNSPGGDVSGAICEGAGCQSYVLPAFSDWATYCPGGGPDLNVAADQDLPAGGCYNSITIANRKTLYLTDTSQPYYIRSVNFTTNFATLAFGPGGRLASPNDKITVYAEVINNNHMNGNQFYNPFNAPHQVEFNYIGSADFMFNGTSAFNALFTAPYADVEVLGNFIYNGGIWAKSLDVLGKATLYGDEKVGGMPVVTDMNFALKKTSQRYR